MCWGTQGGGSGPFRPAATSPCGQRRGGGPHGSGCWWIQGTEASAGTHPGRRRTCCSRWESCSSESAPAVTDGMPTAGDVLIVGPKASVQFAQPIGFRVIRVHPWSTCDGWVWLDGYQLNLAGTATVRRSIYVRVAGLVRAEVVSARRRETHASQRQDRPAQRR
jgi:hypothetical protein